MVHFYGGYKEGKMPGGKILYSPKWENGFQKPADPPLYYDEAVQPAIGSGWFKEKMGDPDVEAFAEGAVGMFGLLLDVGVAQYKSKVK